ARRAVRSARADQAVVRAVRRPAERPRSHPGGDRPVPAVAPAHAKPPGGHAGTGQDAGQTHIAGGTTAALTRGLGDWGLGDWGLRGTLRNDRRPLVGRGFSRAGSGRGNPKGSPYKSISQRTLKINFATHSKD